MDIAQCAQNYLANRPDSWTALVNRLSSRISLWCASQINNEDVSFSRNEFAEDLFSELLSPQVVYLVKGCQSDDEARDLIGKVISDLLNDKTVEAVEKEQYEDEIVDIVRFDADEDFGWDEESFVITRGYEEDYEDEKPIASIHTPVSLHVDESELKPLISELFQVNVSEILSPTGVIYRLNIVDFALYKALMQHPDLLKSLDWRTFERLLGDILERFGYEVELQRGTKDGGVDLFAIKKMDTFGPQRFLLQAKRWSNKVGVDPVRQLAFLHSHHRMTKSCLATTASFTQGAWELAHQYRWQMELRDFEGIQEWIKQAAAIKK